MFGYEGLGPSKKKAAAPKSAEAYEDVTNGYEPPNRKVYLPFRLVLFHSILLSLVSVSRSFALPPLLSILLHEIEGIVGA